MIDRVMDSRGFDNFDWRYVATILAIVSLGVLSLYSITGSQSARGVPLYTKQAMWVVVGCGAFFAMLMVNYHKITRVAYIVYGVALVLLVLVLLVGRTSHGAQRWIPLGPFAFQPSEFAKLALILVLARYFASAPRTGWLPCVIIPGLMMAPGLLLILRQPDLGSGLSYLSIYVGMLLLVGIRSKALNLILLFSLMLFPFVWEVVWGALHEYQRERIVTFVDPSYDTGGRGYHALQSRIAIGSGELTGKGLHGGTQSQLNFLPEGHTDFIFAVFAEEWGFLGVLAILGLFCILMMLAMEIAIKAKDVLGTLIAGGVISMVVFSMVINIGMTVGMFPIVGIPLPMMSYGGSAIVITMASLGLLLNVKRGRISLLY